MFLKFKKLKKSTPSRAWWHTPVLLATGQAEEGGLQVPGQPGQLRDHVSKQINKYIHTYIKGLVMQLSGRVFAQHA
jgi:hypothetical protein